MTFHLFPRAVPKSATGGADCARFQCFLSPRHPYLADFPSAAVQQDFSAWQKSADLPVPQAYHHPASPADNPRSHHKNQQNPAKLPAPAFFCHALSGKSPPQYRSDCIFHCIAVLPEFVWLKPLLSRNALNRVIIFLLFQILADTSSMPSALCKINHIFYENIFSFSLKSDIMFVE